MRVPDLDWPTDLFTDVIVPCQDSVAMLPATSASMWRDTLNAWLGDAGAPWHLPAPASDQFAF